MVIIILLAIARVFLDGAVITADNKGEKDMTNETTNEATETAQHTNGWSLIRPILDTMWWLELGVEVNFISGSKAA